MLADTIWSATGSKSTPEDESVSLITELVTRQKKPQTTFQGETLLKLCFARRAASVVSSPAAACPSPVLPVARLLWDADPWGGNHIWSVSTPQHHGGAVPAATAGALPALRGVTLCPNWWH